MKRDEVFKFLEINLGLVICSIGISCFFWPTGFITGGASGLSILLEQLIPKISNVVFLYIINISLLVISLPILGKNYFLKNIKPPKLQIREASSIPPPHLPAKISSTYRKLAI